MAGEVKIGQVYREKDKRFVRYVRIYCADTKWRRRAWWVWPCDANGKSDKGDRSKNSRRASLISVDNLQKRFELVKDVNNDGNR